MPVTHTTKAFAVADAQVALLTADSVTAPTYGALVDVTGIKKVGLDFDMQSVELRGDNKRLDQDTILVGCTVTFDHAKLNLDALPVFIGGATVDSGTTPTQKAIYTRLGSNVLPYFKLEAKTPTGGVDVVTGDAHLLFPKLKVTKYSLGFAEEDYQIFSGEAKGVFTISNDTLFQLILNETAAAIV